MTTPAAFLAGCLTTLLAVAAAASYAAHRVDADLSAVDFTWDGETEAY